MDLQVSDLKGETVVKTPGSINGESFVLKNLEDCSVFILDYSSEVEVTNCSNCQIFVGPVDGPAIFDGVRNCSVAVACQQFQAKGCKDVEFGLYCATQPSLSSSRGIRIAPWAGAYPGLTAHFAAANLDPSAAANHWNKVYDAQSGDSGSAEPNFEVVAGADEWWEVPLEGAGPPDNPVPRPDGSLYSPPAGPRGFDAGSFEEETPAPVEAPAPLQNGGGAHAPSQAQETVPSGMLDPAASDEHPRVTAAKQKLQARLAEQARAEAAKKAEAAAAAAKYLESFYEKRNRTKAERIKAIRKEAEAKATPESGPQGSNEWERTISLLDLNASRPSGTDLSRFKAVLLSLKAQGGVPGAPKAAAAAAQ